MLSQILHEAALAAEEQEKELFDLKAHIRILENRISSLEENSAKDNNFFKELSEMLYNKYH